MGVEDVSKEEREAELLKRLSKGKTFDVALKDALDRAEKFRTGAWEPVPVPLEEWGRIMSGEASKPGLYPGLHVVAAGTSIGKTALATSIATKAAQAGGLVAYFALELSAGQVALRMASELHGFGHWAHAAKGRGAEREHLEECANVLRNRGIWIYEPEPGVPLPIYEWAAAIRELSDRMETKTVPLLVLDYTQLVGLGGGDAEARQRLSVAAAELRRAARECDVAVLAISSVARQNYSLMGIGGWVEAECDKSGHMGNPDALLVGKESGEIEFFADSQTTIISVARLEKQTTSALCVAKNREGLKQWAPGLFREGKWADTVARDKVSEAAAEEIQRKLAGKKGRQEKPTMSGDEVSELIANEAAKKQTKAGSMPKKKPKA